MKIIKKTHQSKLVEPMITENWPKGHKIRHPKNSWLKFYESDQLTYSSILKKIQELLPENKKVVALSGGKDSGVVLHRLFQDNLVDRALYLRTNTGIQPTEDFVIDTCKSYGIPLDIREPTPNSHIYVAICLEVGFPSFDLHDMLMKYLKYSTMLKYVEEPQFKKQKAVLMSGIRKFESKRRKFNYDQPINNDSNKIYFCNPIFYETDEEVYRYYLENNLKRSRAYEYTNTSLECGCGTFANKNDMKAIRILDPKRAEFFEDLKIFISKHGTKMAKKHLTWGGENWTKSEINDVMDKYLGKNYQHAINVSQMICGSECGGTMRGAYAGI